ncbi:MAG: hypothetical protein H6601_04265 [Flavobacteriales bacterium]|nr:hypothetical protein [Flavobacteriales bacterium]
MRKNILLATVAGLLTLMITEIGLRKMRWTAGQFQRNKWVHQVDELRYIKGFLADSVGIFKVDTAACRVIEHAIRARQVSQGKMPDYCKENDLVVEVGAVYDNHLFPEDRSGEFFKRVDALTSGPLSCHDSTLIQFAAEPVNSYGFYSIPFASACKGKGRVLMLGDSFTWGHSTSNKTKSFSNTLLARGYTVFNTGISGSDIPQYNLVFEQFFDQVQPDVVVVNLFMGNDIVPLERKPQAHVPIHYSTNAGNILSYQAGVLFPDMQSAYDNVMWNMTIPLTDKFNLLMSKTVVTTIIWLGLVRFGLVEHRFTTLPYLPTTYESRGELQKLIDGCAEKRVPLIISIIPQVEGKKLIGSEKTPAVFEGMDFHEPEMNLDQYNIDDGHFNNDGHLAYANYLQELIDKKLASEAEK